MKTQPNNAERKELIRKFNILFHDEWSSKRNFKFRQLFQAVKDLGKIEFEQYLASAKGELHEKPWRAETSNRAQIITRRARKRAQNDAVEDSWRFSIENDVFFRMDSEVTCTKCGLRLWIHDGLEILEANKADHPGPSSDRNVKRSACTCSGAYINRQDGNIFDFHIGTGITYRDEVKNHVKTEQPDRVYGLTKTEQMMTLLDEVNKRKKSLEWEDCSPYPAKDGLLFPFLVLESKSGTSRDSDNTALYQSALVVRYLLKMQHELTEKAGSRTRWNKGPFVWYLSHIGPNWVVRGAYRTTISTRNSMDDPGWRFVRLWSGNITQEDDSLRLLLIVDQIVDWARDVYREDILNEMRAVGRLEERAPDISSPHSDILSHRPDVRTLTSSIVSLDINSITDDDRVQKLNISHLLRFLDVEGSVIRDARYVHHNYYGICVTVTNVKDMFKISTSENVQRKLARQLLQLFDPGDAWLVTCATLQGLQYLWTGRDNESLWSDENFIARFGMMSSFIVEPPGPQDGAGPSAGDWQQTHDLCFIAIEEGAIESLEHRASYCKPRNYSFSHYPEASEKLVHDMFKRQRYASVDEHLSAALTTQIWVTTTSRRPLATEYDTDGEALFLHHGRARYLPAATVNDAVQDDAMKVITLPKKFWKDLRRGSQEFAATYLITSKQYADLTEDPQAEGIRTDLAELWPKLSLVIPESESAIVIRAAKGKRDCLFLKNVAFSPHRKHVVLQIQHAFRYNVPIWDNARTLIYARRAKKPRMSPGSLNDAISILEDGLTLMEYVLGQRDKMNSHSNNEDADRYSIYKRMRAYLHEVVQIPPSEEELDRAMVKMTKKLNKVAKAYNLRALLKELHEVYDAMDPGDEGSESAQEYREVSVDLDETLFGSENEQSDSSDFESRGTPQPNERSSRDRRRPSLSSQASLKANRAGQTRSPRV